MKPLRPHVKLIALAIITATALTGCGTMSGYDADNEFHCKAPDGVQCQSMSGVYANRKVSSEGKKSPVQQNKGEVIPYSQLTTPAARNMGNGQPPTYFGAIRSEPTTLRTWVMAYRDTDGDVVDQLYLYMAVDSGRWLLEHNEQTIRDNFAPKKPMATNSGVNLGLKKEADARGVAAKPDAPSTAYGLEKDDASDKSSGGKSSSSDTAAMIRQLQDSMKPAADATRTSN